MAKGCQSTDYEMLMNSVHILQMILAGFTDEMEGKKKTIKYSFKFSVWVKYEAMYYMVNTGEVLYLGKEPDLSRKIKCSTLAKF